MEEIKEGTISNLPNDNEFHFMSFYQEQKQIKKNNSNNQDSEQQDQQSYLQSLQYNIENNIKNKKNQILKGVQNDHKIENQMNQQIFVSIQDIMNADREKQQLKKGTTSGKETPVNINTFNSNNLDFKNSNNFLFHEMVATSAFTTQNYPQILNNDILNQSIDHTDMLNGLTPQIRKIQEFANEQNYLNHQSYSKNQEGENSTKNFIKNGSSYNNNKKYIDTNLLKFNNKLQTNQNTQYEKSNSSVSNYDQNNKFNNSQQIRSQSLVKNNFTQRLESIESESQNCQSPSQIMSEIPLEANNINSPKDKILNLKSCLKKSFTSNEDKSIKNHKISNLFNDFSPLYYQLESDNKKAGNF
ncbi:hypothetical protein PPERSA_06158 [Pseudocohnilembus persalinus]|uniref:Uncharacterized protein n=1 Tax=Pseudocohnilembus persalinus TaxID=266149 RepID=A0A0V0QED6_PSEPJ|nr:hypothetical protein PPERSA_06158 [Pseudocohnilembus persalinus]|eukprot:KRX00515.1 hypothetical protein PPERSA_06158 [Pseudocohnilembus persalinus]